MTVVGGGPAGSFFACFLLDLAQCTGLDLEVKVFEAKDFTVAGPAGCNMCGGGVSESLVQTLAMEGINLPQPVVARGIESYVLHMDVGVARIETPLQEMRIAAVYRGSGPRGMAEWQGRSFDGHLLNLAAAKGAQDIADRVVGLGWEEDRPVVKTHSGLKESSDLLAMAGGCQFRFAETGRGPPVEIPSAPDQQDLYQ